MTIYRFTILAGVAGCLGFCFAQNRSAADAGTPQVDVSHSGSTWTLAGRTNTVEFNESTLAIAVHAGPAEWHMAPSSTGELLVADRGDQFRIRLRDAGRIAVTPYETGFKSGIRIVLDRFRNAGLRSPDTSLGLRVVLTMCLEGSDEDLIFEAMVNELGSAVVKEMDWPPAIDGREADYTVISSDNGTLLPRNWPKVYSPILRSANEHSVIQSHLIESWSMSWWGFLKGSSAMIVIIETPDDAAYTFSHPAGGPTVMGPAWRAQLGHFAYLRRLRMGFFPKAGYVDLAKRYRRYAIDSGLFVSLKSKIAARPIVANLVGAPFAGASVLRNKKPGGANYDTKNPASNRSLTTFADNVERLRQFKARGIDHLNVSISGWLYEGYDRQTPDALPPSPAAGGWQGMKALFDTCKQLGYTCWLHDQYRDYYLDAPSWNPDFAVHEEDSTSPPTAFPGTRFKHDWKDGYIPLMDNWDGGAQGYLNNDFMLGHLVKNYRVIFEHGIYPQGSYQDVFGYIPPDEDFNPDHPSTRTESMNARAAVFRWVAHHLGIVGTEAGSDWVVPYVDYTTSRFNRGANTGTDPDHQDAIPIPLYELVYHDAVVTAASPNNLRAFLHGNAPQMGYGRTDAALEQVRRLAALHRRVGLLEMTNHEFLDPERRRERTTFADGTTVTVDWQNNSVEIQPDVSPTTGGSAVPLPGGGLAQHPFLYCGEWQDQGHSDQWMHIVRGGKVVWSYSIPRQEELGDCTTLSNGNIVFSRRLGASEVTPDKKIVWNYNAPPGTEIHTAWPVDNDRVLIMQNGNPAKLLIIRKSTGKIEKQMELATRNPAGVHGQFRHIRMTPAGTFLVAHLDLGKVVEYSADGKEIWSVSAPSAWAAVRLRNGNTLISGNQHGYVREVNPKGEIVWEINKNDLPGIPLYTVQEVSRLSNGNTLINNWAGSLPQSEWPQAVQLIEVTPDKKVVWALRDWTTLGPASSTELLDDPRARR